MKKVRFLQYLHNFILLKNGLFWRGHAKIFDIERVNMPDVEVVEEKCMNSEKSFRGHTDLNHGPIGLQPIALPLSYTPFLDSVCRYHDLTAGSWPMSTQSPLL